MVQQELFDLGAGRKHRDAGMDVAATKREEALRVAKDVAIRIATGGDGTCDINQVNKIITPMGIRLGNAAGSVFKGGLWGRIGFGQADRIVSHARIISRWRLLGGYYWSKSA